MTECWLWQGKTTNEGYGSFYDPRTKRSVFAHRAAYEEAFGPVPSGLELDHLCRNPSCVRPSHLEAVTHRENILRSPIQVAAINARKTECPRGHAYEGHNIIWKTTNGSRQCRACNVERTRRWRATLLTEAER